MKDRSLSARFTGASLSWWQVQDHVETSATTLRVLGNFNTCFNESLRHIYESLDKFLLLKDIAFQSRLVQRPYLLRHSVVVVVHDGSCVVIRVIWEPSNERSNELLRIPTKFGVLRTSSLERERTTGPEITKEKRIPGGERVGKDYFYAGLPSGECWRCY